jgi:hypothetical protein
VRLAGLVVLHGGLVVQARDHDLAGASRLLLEDARAIGLVILCLTVVRADLIV